MTTNFSVLFRALAGSDFILIGGLAAAVHGAARATYDVDVLYSRTPRTRDSAQLVEEVEDERDMVRLIAAARLLDRRDGEASAIGMQVEQPDRSTSKGQSFVPGLSTRHTNLQSNLKSEFDNLKSHLVPGAIFRR